MLLTTKTRLLLSALLAFTLAAGTASADPSPKNWSPLAVGNLWEYDLLMKIETFEPGKTPRSMTVNGEHTVEVTGITEQIKTDTPIYEVQNRIKKILRDADIDLSARYTELLSINESELRVHGHRNLAQKLHSGNLVQYDAPLRRLHFPLMKGKNWTVGTVTSRSEDSESTSAQTARVVGIENVKTPAGVIPDCVRVQYVTHESGVVTFSDGTTTTLQGVDIETTTWYADGIGMVKQVKQQSASKGDMTSTEKQMLILKKHQLH